MSATTPATKSLTLEGKGVLITRPHPQGEPLAQKITQLGGHAYLLPAITILPPEHPAQLIRQLERVADYDLYLFISTNAVKYALQFLPDQRLPHNRKVACVGKATASALQKHGIKADITPQPPYNSESLLVHPQLQQMKGQRVLIFRGEGGRELIATILLEREAKVDYAEVYRRVAPDYSVQQLQLPWSKIHFVIATSSEIIRNLMTMLGNQASNIVADLVLIVVSQRTATEAAKLGFKRIIIAEGADDEALIKAISAR